MNDVFTSNTGRVYFPVASKAKTTLFMNLDIITQEGFVALCLRFRETGPRVWKVMKVRGNEEGALLLDRYMIALVQMPASTLQVIESINADLAGKLNVAVAELAARYEGNVVADPHEIEARIEAVKDVLAQRLEGALSKMQLPNFAELEEPSAPKPAPKPAVSHEDDENEHGEDD